MGDIKNTWKKLKGTLPLEYLSGLPDIHIHGMRDVRVQGHRGLMAYSEERVLVKAADRLLCVTGQGLVLSNMTMAEVHIRGRIRSVETVD